MADVISLVDASDKAVHYETVQCLEDFMAYVHAEGAPHRLVIVAQRDHPDGETVIARWAGGPRTALYGMLHVALTMDMDE